MAIDKKVANDLAPKVLARLEELDALVIAAETSKDAPTPIADAVKKAQAFAAGDALPVEVFDEKGLKASLAALKAVETFISLMGPKVETVDRTRGDLLASAIDLMVKGDALEDSVLPVATDLVERWLATRPSRSGGSSATPEELGFRVVTRCKVAGCKWSSHTEKNNLNSARHQAITHARSAHKIEMGAKSGHADFAKTTSAFESVIREGKQSAESDTFAVSRAS
jgi:hypothetical protein